jgi:hypothetical protein
MLSPIIPPPCLRWILINITKKITLVALIHQLTPTIVAYASTTFNSLAQQSHDKAEMGLQLSYMMGGSFFMSRSNPLFSHTGSSATLKIS